MSSFGKNRAAFSVKAVFAAKNIEAKY